MRTNLRENEKIIMTTQRHPLGVFGFYVLALAVLVLWIWSGGGRAALAFRYTFGYGFILVAILSVLKTLAWQRDIWVVTNQRVVDEQGVFTIRSRECPLDKINNVMVAQSVLGRLLGYGNIQIRLPEKPASRKKPGSQNRQTSERPCSSNKSGTARG